MDAKDLLNNSCIHHGRNLVRLMNRKGLKVEDLEKALQLSQTQIQELNIVSFTQIIEAYRLMLKQEREEVSKLQKRVDELEKQKNRKPENE